MKIAHWFFFSLLSLISNSFSQPVNWINIYSKSCRDLEIVNDSIMYACFYSGGIEFSSNGGNNWININPSIHYYDMLKVAVNKNTKSVFVYAHNYKIVYRSTDNGNSWAEILYNQLQITDMKSSMGNIYAIDYGGMFYKSTNDGISWDSSFVTSGSDIGLIEIDITSNGILFIATSGDKIYRSNDSGISWTKLTSDTISNWNYSLAINGIDDIAVNQNPGKMILSKDLGTTWEIIDVPFYSWSNSDMAYDSNYNLYLGRNSIFKYNGGSWTNLGGSFSDLRKIRTYGDKVYLATSTGIYKYDPSIPIYVGSNYFPMQIGNKYQYRRSSVTASIYNYSLIEYEIQKDTVINSNKYFLFKDNLLRYSELEKKIFVWYNDSAKIYMDFTLPPMATFIHYLYTFDNTATVIDGTKNIFNSYVKFKGFSVGSNYGPWGNTKERFGENLGPIMYEHCNYAGPDHNSEDNLIMMIQYDSTGVPQYYTYHNKPQIAIVPIVNIFSSLFHLEFDINHFYSKFFDPSSPHQGINFIKDVKFISFYEKEDSIVFNDTIFAVNTAKTNRYTVTINADTILLQEGFTLKYKIFAKDKGIIPEISFSPDTGFYNCKWSGVNSIAELSEKISSYFLSQNYPNPFNPSTKIKYAVSSTQKVVLKVFDILGNEIATLVNEEKIPGEYEVEFSAGSFGDAAKYYLSSGVYFYQLRMGSFIQTKKMILMR